MIISWRRKYLRNLKGNGGRLRKLEYIKSSNNPKNSIIKKQRKLERITSIRGEVINRITSNQKFKEDRIGSKCRLRGNQIQDEKTNSTIQENERWYLGKKDYKLTTRREAKY